MRSKIVMGNWKMHGSLDSIRTLLVELVKILPSSMNAECVVLPPAIYLPLIQEQLQGTSLHWGAQNVYPKEAGAFTGELSGPMLKDYACRYVLVGHSERRQLFNEDEKFIAEKFHHAKDHDMIPVLCVGETQSERDQGQTEHVLRRQLLAVTSEDNCFENCIIAYEPVWAIGTGQTAKPDDVQTTHEFIRNLIAEFSPSEAKKLPILYGGSVNENNAQSLFAMPDVDGGLIGGASLQARHFVEILKCIN